MNIDVSNRPAGLEALPKALQPAPRWVAAVGFAILVSILVRASSGQAAPALLAGWDAGVLAWLVVTVKMSRERQYDQTRPQEPASTLALVAITVAAVIGLVGALALTGKVVRIESSGQALRLGLAVAAVVGSWLLVRTECRLRYARLSSGRRRNGGASAAPVYSFSATNPDPDQLSVWEFVYYALPVARLYDASDPAPPTPAMCQLAILQSAVAYASIFILISFGLSLIGPGLNGAHVMLGG